MPLDYRKKEHREKSKKYSDSEADTALISGGAALVGLILSFSNHTLNSTIAGLILCLFIAPFQIYYANSNNLKGRNWSNMLNFSFCLFVAISLYIGNGGVEAIGGYATVGLLSLKYWWHTSRALKNDFGNSNSNT